MKKHGLAAIFDGEPNNDTAFASVMRERPDTIKMREEASYRLITNAALERGSVGKLCFCFRYNGYTKSDERLTEMIKGFNKAKKIAVFAHTKTILPMTCLSLIELIRLILPS